MDEIVSPRRYPSMPSTAYLPTNSFTLQCDAMSRRIASHTRYNLFVVGGKKDGYMDMDMDMFDLELTLRRMYI